MRVKRWAAKEGPIRWWIWLHATRLPSVCPAGSHSRIVWAMKDADPKVNWMCREDCAANGTCWCGKLRRETADVGK